MNLQVLFLFDISTSLMMIILAYLSKRLGDAMKIKSYFKILFVTASLIIVAFIIDFVAGSLSSQPLSQLLPLISLSIRFISGATGLVICLIYWKWLFSAFKN